MITKFIAALVVTMMLFSGVGIMTMGMNQELVVPDSEIVVSEPRATVPRVSLAEDFTNWNCGPCASHNPAWTAAINAVGYDKVAPAYLHFSWPSDIDPMYKHDSTDLATRWGYYGVSGVPDTFLDGGDITTRQTQAQYETAFNNATAIPANVKITTSGLLNMSTKQGSIDVHLECMETLTAANYRLFVYIWENNVTRTLEGDAPPYPNTEDQLDWAVWDVVPDGDGDPVWASGAAIGDFVDIHYDFPINDTVDPWVEDEIGATIFLQNYDTKAVQQAYVELFDNAAPVVNLLTPAKAVSELILNGSAYDITWTATDIEDMDNSTLDIKIEYSANVGST